MIHNQTLVVVEMILKNAPKIHKTILLPHLQSVAPFFPEMLKITQRNKFVTKIFFRLEHNCYLCTVH